MKIVNYSNNLLYKYISLIEKDTQNNYIKNISVYSVNNIGYSKLLYNYINDYMSETIKQFVIINGKNWFVGSKDGISYFFIDLENNILYDDINNTKNIWLKIIDISIDGKYIIVEEFMYYHGYCGFCIYDISDIIINNSKLGDKKCKKLYHINLDKMITTYKELEKYDKNNIKCYFSKNHVEIFNQ